MNNHWNQHAKLWHSVGSPLRPNEQDIAIVKHYIESNPLNKIQTRCLILGVTPEITQLLQDLGIRFYGIDYSQEMISALWKCNSPDQCVIGNWLNMPFNDNSFDFIIGDGSLNVVGSSHQTTTLLNELRRILKPSGRLIIRYFIIPETKEPIDKLLHTPDSNFHAFKWRIAMSLQSSFEKGISLTSIHTLFARHKDDLFKINNWKDSDFYTINSYKSSAAIYSFPSLVELSSLLGNDYDIEEIRYASYYLADRCPILLAKKKD